MSQPDIRYLKPPYRDSRSGASFSNNKKLHENYNHVIIDLKKSLSKSQSELRHEDVSIKVLEDTVKESRRASIKTMEWLNGKVESLRKRFSVTAATAGTQVESNSNNNNSLLTIPTNRVTHNKSIFEVDGDLMKMCDKFTSSNGNRFTTISYSFDKIVTKFAGLIRNHQIEIHRRTEEPPRGILLLPLSDATNQTLLDFSEMGGYSLGRGSRIVKRAVGSLSRSHSLIYFENNQVFIKDCDSKTGTFVCGKLLGSSIPVLMDNFDFVQLGYGPDSEDSIQFMAIFLSKWNSNEFPSMNTQLNDLQSHMFSRTISVNNLDTIKPPVPDRPESKTVVSAVNSPKLNEIAKKQSETEKQHSKNHQIVFEIPTIIEKQKESVSENHIILQMDNLKLNQESNNSSHNESRSTNKINLATTPILKDSTLSSPLTVNINPPIPKPRITKRNLSKSIDGLNEMEVVDPNKHQNDNVNMTTRVPIETALAARKKSTVPIPTATATIIEIPEFLKLENLKVPEMSPVMKLLNSIPERKVREFSILFDKKRKERLQKLRESNKSECFQVVQGGPTSIRYESFVDFGTGTSDISDGLGETVQGSKNQKINWAFNNYHIVWRIEGINEQSGNKTSIQIDGNSNSYSIDLETDQKSKVKIGSIKFKSNKTISKKKPQHQEEDIVISFKINTNETFKEICGKECEEGVSIEALEQLTYFYPHLEIPKVVITRPHQHLDSGKKNSNGTEIFLISLKTKRNTEQIGTFMFEKHTINWMKHSLVWAVDVNTEKLQPDSIIHDTIQGAMMLYCLKSFID